ncbi:MAG: S9 family peptidase [Synergistaceae bacterium]|nr:S9 family peptidase [Synergistaceae bacterium]
MKRNIEQRDLLNLYFPSNPRFSPDGKYVAYRVSRPNEEKNGYDSDVWVYDTEQGTNRKLTDTGRVSFFCWSHDGSFLIFASGGNENKNENKDENKNEKSKRTSCYSIALQGGEAAPLFDVPYAASAIQALDERRYLLTVVWEPEYENPENADVMIFQQIPFMANGKGYIGQQRTALAVYDTRADDTGTDDTSVGDTSAGDTCVRKIKRLTPPSMEVFRYSLNKDKTEALVVGVEYQNLKPTENAVYKVDLFTGAMQCLSEGLSFAFAYAAWVDDSVLVTGTDHKSMGVNENLKFYILENGRLLCLTDCLDSSLGHAVAADSHYGCSDLAGMFFPRDGALNSAGPVYCATEVMKSRLYELTKDGRQRQLTFETSAVVDYCVEARGRVAFVAYEGLYPPELYLLESGGEIPGREKRLTNFNRPLFDELRLAQPIHVTVDNGQGWKLDGWYMRPADFQEGKKYPTLLHIHGGPKAAFGDIYHHEMQCWAAKGYAVIYCNPRGGDGRGSAFQDIRGHYGDLDYHDLMVFTDWCVENLRFIDSSRLGVTGGSYGGYMTNWIVTQTRRFKAAVSQRGISNWVSKFGGCDIGYYYVEDQHLGTPWHNMENLWRESPLKHVDKAKTPMLFIHSTEDFRCELNQGFQMFTALKVLGVESRMCVFKGENHELSRSGKPRNRLARLRAISDWFHSHL